MPTTAKISTFASCYYFWLSYKQSCTNLVLNRKSWKGGGHPDVLKVFQTWHLVHHHFALMYGKRQIHHRCFWIPGLRTSVEVTYTKFSKEKQKLMFERLGCFSKKEATYDMFSRRKKSVFAEKKFCPKQEEKKTFVAKKNTNFNKQSLENRPHKSL